MRYGTEMTTNVFVEKTGTIAFNNIPYKVFNWFYARNRLKHQWNQTNQNFRNIS